MAGKSLIKKAVYIPAWFFKKAMLLIPSLKGNFCNTITILGKSSSKNLDIFK
jgi:hypothetical protein